MHRKLRKDEVEKSNLSAARLRTVNDPIPRARGLALVPAWPDFATRHVPRNALKWVQLDEIASDS